MKLVYKLLSRRISAWQWAGFFLANLLGTCIVLGSVQFYHDVAPLFRSGDSFMKPGYLVVAKHVSTLRTLGGAGTGFSPDEVDELRRQPFTRSVGEFTPAGFEVYASVAAGPGGPAFGTEMFFEALPDAYVDVDLAHWRYEPGSGEVPVVVPRNYLNLYNFGFARSRGLPTLSEGMISLVGINLVLRGPGGTMRLRGRITGFSDRLNTILVPQTFMDEANARLAPDADKRPSRLIVEVKNPADARIARFLHDRGYDTEADGDAAGKATYFLRLTTGLVMGVGVVICLLAFYVLLLSVFILLQKHTEKLDTLLLLGYTPAQAARPFHTLCIGLNTATLLLATGMAAWLRTRYLPAFGELYPAYEAGPVWPALATALGLYLLTAALHYACVSRKVAAVWHMHRTRPAARRATRRRQQP